MHQTHFCKKGVKLLLLKLEHQDPQLPFSTFRMPKESGTSGEISSTPRR